VTKAKYSIFDSATIKSVSEKKYWSICYVVYQIVFMFHNW